MAKYFTREAESSPVPCRKPGTDAFLSISGLSLSSRRSTSVRPTISGRPPHLAVGRAFGCPRRSGSGTKRATESSRSKGHPAPSPVSFISGKPASKNLGLTTYEYLESCSPTHVPLKTNCRNSRQILQLIQETLKADVGNAGVGDGPAVRHARVADSSDGSEALKEELRRLVDVEGFDPGDIIILSPFPFPQSWAASLSDDRWGTISVLDDASPRNADRRAIGFAQIGDFKGLESEVVVLVDMPKPGHSEQLRALHYVGMSRARALLSMIYY